MLITLTGPDGKPVAAWSVFWRTFGASNQLLAALALIGLTVWLMNSSKNKKAWMYTFFPAVFMFIMSSWALVRMFLQYTTKEGAWIGLPGNANAIVPVVCVIYLVLAIWMAAETARAIFKQRSGMVRAPSATD